MSHTPTRTADLEMNRMPASTRDRDLPPESAVAHPQTVAELLEARKVLRDQLSHFSKVMLVTFGREGMHELHARPMAVARFDEDSPLLTLWFVTHIESTKVAEVRSEHGAYVIGQDGSRFLSVSGSVDVVRDPARITEMWSKAFEVWFPKGPTDPNVTLLAFYPERAEVWDSTGLAGVRFMFEAAKALVTGEPPTGTPSESGHRLLDLRD